MATKRRTKPEFDTSEKYMAVHDLYPLGTGNRSGDHGKFYFEGKGKSKVMMEDFGTNKKAALREIEAVKNMPGHEKTNPRLVAYMKKQKTNACKKKTATKRGKK